MKNNKNRQWNKYYFTITLQSKCITKPVVLRDVLAHSKEHAYMKLVKDLQYWGFFETQRIRTIKLIYVDTNIDTNNINELCSPSNNGLIKFYKTCRNNKFVDITFEYKCPNYNSYYGVCMLNNESCNMIHTNYCDMYIDIMLSKTMFCMLGGDNK